MVREYKTYTCTYKAEWPVDEYGRLGGMYSLTDLPIKGYVTMERKGILVSQDERRQLYQVQDQEKKFTKRVVNFNDVTNIEEVQNESDK